MVGVPAYGVARKMRTIRNGPDIFFENGNKNDVPKNISDPWCIIRILRDDTQCVDTPFLRDVTPVNLMRSVTHDVSFGTIGLNTRAMCLRSVSPISRFCVTPRIR